MSQERVEFSQIVTELKVLLNVSKLAYLDEQKVFNKLSEQLNRLALYIYRRLDPADDIVRESNAILTDIKNALGTIPQEHFNYSALAEIQRNNHSSEIVQLGITYLFWARELTQTILKAAAVEQKTKLAGNKAKIAGNPVRDAKSMDPATDREKTLDIELKKIYEKAYEKNVYNTIAGLRRLSPDSTQVSVSNVAQVYDALMTNLQHRREQEAERKEEVTVKLEKLEQELPALEQEKAVLQQNANLTWEELPEKLIAKSEGTTTDVLDDEKLDAARRPKRILADQLDAAQKILVKLSEQWGAPRQKKAILQQTIVSRTEEKAADGLNNDKLAVVRQSITTLEDKLGDKWQQRRQLQQALNDLEKEIEASQKNINFFDNTISLIARDRSNRAVHLANELEKCEQELTGLKHELRSLSEIPTYNVSTTALKLVLTDFKNAKTKFEDAEESESQDKLELTKTESFSVEEENAPKNEKITALKNALGNVVVRFTTGASQKKDKILSEKETRAVEIEKTADIAGAKSADDESFPPALEQLSASHEDFEKTADRPVYGTQEKEKNRTRETTKKINSGDTAPEYDNNEWVARQLLRLDPEKLQQEKNKVRSKIRQHNTRKSKLENLKQLNELEQKKIALNERLKALKAGDTVSDKDHITMLEDKLHQEQLSMINLLQDRTQAVENLCASLKQSLHDPYAPCSYLEQIDGNIIEAERLKKEFDQVSEYHLGELAFINQRIEKRQEDESKLNAEKEETEAITANLFHGIAVSDSIFSAGNRVDNYSAPSEIHLLYFSLHKVLTAFDTYIEQLNKSDQREDSCDGVEESEAKSEENSQRQSIFDSIAQLKILQNRLINLSSSEECEEIVLEIKQLCNKLFADIDFDFDKFSLETHELLFKLHDLVYKPRENAVFASNDQPDLEQLIGNVHNRNLSSHGANVKPENFEFTQDNHNSLLLFSEMCEEKLDRDYVIAGNREEYLRREYLSCSIHPELRRDLSIVEDSSTDGVFAEQTSQATVEPESDSDAIENNSDNVSQSWRLRMWSAFIDICCSVLYYLSQCLTKIKEKLPAGVKSTFFQNVPEQTLAPVELDNLCAENAIA